MSAGSRELQRRRRGIIVEIGWGKQTSSVGAAYFDDAPTELNDFAEIFLQRCRAYGAGEGITSAIKTK